MLRNTKLALGVYYLPNIFSQILQISDFIFLISNIIPLYLIHQLGIVVENQINDVLHISSKDL